MEPSPGPRAADAEPEEEGPLPSDDPLVWQALRGCPLGNPGVGANCWGEALRLGSTWWHEHPEQMAQVRSWRGRKALWLPSHQLLKLLGNLPHS
ncbi:hypothetical protein V5799_028928 [Amblyomma americanum]|uniref:Uncharacterized protein n=1 Tax=Amblyomma americanum TaxID=6943 RepID=A0AAQ4DBG5_AMBAM